MEQEHAIPDGARLAVARVDHPFDVRATDMLDLFAEEHEEQSRQFEMMPPNTFSTLACECETISTFFCYGCGADG